MNGEMQIATLAGGCFWCLDAVFRGVHGVSDVVSGYTAGHVENPDYREVCTGRTGHTEAVQIHFDPMTVSYEDLLRIFFTVHDPTTLNRQGADVGTQYRSGIYYQDEAQHEAAQKVIAEIEAAGIWDGEIVTEIQAVGPYYVAEDYHQDYYAKNPTAGYCVAVVGPKVAKFRNKFSEMMKV